MASTATDASSLAEFVRGRRWFRSKTRNITNAEIEDIVTIPGQSARFLVIRLDYSEGDCDNYVITDKGDSSGQPVEALDDDSFRNVLLQSFQKRATYAGQSGELVFARTSAFPDNGATQEIESSVSRAEQSNTSIIFADRFILKLFRKIEPGINPDVEIGAFLTEHGFTHTPAVLGTLEYRSHKGDAYSAGILQQFVRNQGDAWKYTLDMATASLDAFAASGQELSDAQNTEAAEAYLPSARLLGQRTAEMHIALASGKTTPDFDPEPFNSDTGKKLHEEMLAQADIAFESLRRKQATLTGDAAEAAQQLLRLEHRVTERFTALRDQQIHASRIRFHGDYHLGQVLWTGSDFMIIDFEGEPARPLHERRTKTLAMRDVAGMLRSFQYAAYSALFERDASKPSFERWADAWTDSASRAFVDAYIRTANGSVFLPSDENERRVLLDAFILHKALYEVAYEMNNRPDWVRIPLRGILSLIV
jgi:maltose alpha-D-glucosyltransferase/alpha-amylase